MGMCTLVGRVEEEVGSPDEHHLLTFSTLLYAQVGAVSPYQAVKETGTERVRDVPKGTQL